jgi:hypothetical protein
VTHHSSNNHGIERQQQKAKCKKQQQKASFQKIEQKVEN